MRKTLDNVTVVLVSFKNFEREINRRLLSTNININDSYEAERLATEPSYNYQHEKIKLRSGLKQTQSKGQSKERKLSPSIVTDKKKNKVEKNNKHLFSPKMNPTLNYFKKK